MSIFVDIGIVVIVALSTFLGYKKGLIGVAFKIISFLIAIILAFVLCKPVSSYIMQQTIVDDKIEETIENALRNKQVESPQEQSNTIGIPEVITDYIQKEITNATVQAQNQVATVVAQNVTVTAINAISFIAIFIILKIVLLVLKLFSEQLANFPIIKQFNKLGGIIYGVLRGLFIIYLLLGIVSFMAPMLVENRILVTITNSYLGNAFYQHNLLLKLLF